MALARLGGARRPENYTWPGFVDALATLLMVIIFVLLVFVLIQVNLAYRVAGQDATMNDMRAQIVSLGDLLNLERKANEELKDELAGISSLLDDTTKERDSLVTQLANATATLSLRDSEIRQLTALQAQTEESLDAARKTIAERVAALEAIELTLEQAQAKLMESEVEIADAAARNVSSLARISELETKNAASQAEVAQMTNAVTALRLRVEELTSLLAEKEAQAARDKIAIASLGKSLNNALASRVQELQRFRSEFFGRLREVLRGRDDVRIVGDRFVFQSEVLFAQGAANLGPEGEEKLGQLAVALNQIAAEIPEDIDWILQVEGHTDDIPVRAGRFADNWDLSTERALSVVRFLAESGLPANRAGRGRLWRVPAPRQRRLRRGPSPEPPDRDEADPTHHRQLTGPPLTTM